MNPPNPSDPAGSPASEKEIMSAMFASMVIQQTNMASIFLGLAPHPQTGQIARDLDHARYFIDQLEMIEAKTRGNLDKMEEGLLKQSLTSLRLAFVEAVSKPAPAAPDETSAPAAAAPAPAPAAPAPGAAEESHKKFSKKY
ncbi:MAG: DUF1844 domain-containing protein [Verrucomicrobiota bacterium]|jgi:hypothetical protein